MPRRSRAAAALALLLAAAVAAGALLAVQRDEAAASRSAAPSFARDVAPVLRDKCAGCHAIGGIAPFPFRTAADVAGRAALVAAAVESGRMPPWPPGRRSPAFAGQRARTLTEAERDTLVRWARGQLLRPGAPRDRTPVGPPPRAGDRAVAGETVRVLRPREPYLPRATGGAADDYRCFLVDPGLKQDVLVTSARIEPGVAALVHHVILYRVPPRAVAAARARDAASPGPGWSCFGGTGLETDLRGGGLDDAPWIAAWAPGSGPQRLGDGLGIPLPRGSRVVMQVHYNLANGARPDRSRAVLTIVPASAGRDRVSTVLLPAPVELPCAPGTRGRLCDRDAALTEQARRHGPAAALVPVGLLLLCGKNPGSPLGGAATSCDRRVTDPTTVHAVGGHMHLLGRSLRVVLNPGTRAERVLLDLPRWDFHWQGVYRLARPVEARPGDVLRVSCTHDARLRAVNAPPAARAPRYTLWGEGTTDEMCLGVLQVTRG
jgi:mono/diheme cytochrome c family protein